MLENNRRIRGFLLTERMLHILLYEGAMARCTRGVPLDATFLGVFIEPQRNAFVVVFEHPSFKVLPDGVAMELEHTAFEVIEDPNSAARGCAFEELTSQGGRTRPC